MTVDEVCRLVREHSLRRPYEVEFVRLGGGWAIRAYFDDIIQDYRVTAEGKMEDVRDGFPSWPPSRAVVTRGRCGLVARRVQP